jgi:hypothetical protein
MKGRLTAWEPAAMMAFLNAMVLLLAGLLLAFLAGGLGHLQVVGADEAADAAHDGDLAHLGHGGQAAGQLADDLFLVGAQLVDVDGGRAEVNTE